MVYLLRIDINLFAMIILSIIFISIYIQGSNDDLDSKLFLLLIGSNFIMLIMEICSWAFDGGIGLAQRGLNYWSNFIFLACNQLPIFFWLMYFDYKLYEDFEGLKKRIKIYILPFVFVVLMIVFKKNTDFVFYIDDLNFYHRRMGIVLITIADIAVILGTLVVTFMQREKFDKKTKIAMSSFGILPTIGAVFQMLYYGLFLIWGFMAIAILILFIFIEFETIKCDYLTGLSNRKQIDELIHKKIKQAQYKKTFGLIMIDIDDFKRINDCYGHNEGDEVLIIVGRLLERAMKAKFIIGRFGGDEYIIIAEVNDEERLAQIASDIENKINAYNEKKIKPYSIKYSLGFTLYDHGKHADYKALIKDVDEKMYVEKKKKKKTG